MSASWHFAALAAALAVSSTASRPRLPVKALALPELTTSARHALVKMRAAPIDRRGSRLGLGQHAGDGGARVEQHKQKVGASGITDAGRSGGDAHAVDGGEVRQVLRREGRDVSHGVNSLAIYWRGASMAGP